jgi:hypothetical protein
MLMPEDVADTVIEGMEAERFLILPHFRVGDAGVLPPALAEEISQT